MKKYFVFIALFCCFLGKSQVVGESGPGTPSVAITGTNNTVNEFTGGSKFLTVTVSIVSGNTAGITYTAGNAISTSTSVTTAATSFTLPTGTWELIYSSLTYSNQNNVPQVQLWLFGASITMTTNNALQTMPSFTVPYIGAIRYFSNSITSLNFGTNGLYSEAVQQLSSNVGLPVYIPPAYTTVYMMPVIAANFSTNSGSSNFLFNLRFIRID